MQLGADKIEADKLHPAALNPTDPNRLTNLIRRTSNMIFTGGPMVVFI
jgi:hypothetical protein